MVALDLVMDFGDDGMFPFVEDENANITGSCHQDKAEFAAAVNRYDEALNGGPIAGARCWNATDIRHQWVTHAGEDFLPVSPDAPGAMPVTTLWGAR